MSAQSAAEQVPHLKNPIVRLFETAAKDPQRIALASNRTRLSYGEFASIVQRCAQRLRVHGIGPSSIVAVDCEPEIGAVISCALLQLGATSTTIAAQLLPAVAGQLSAIVTDAVDRGHPVQRRIVLESRFFETLDATARLMEIAELRPDEVVRVVFSSGTTGVPKGVPFSKTILEARLASARANWMPKLPFLSMLGPETVTGYQTMSAQLLSGETYLVARDATETLARIAEFGVRSIKTSPAKLADLIRARRDHPTDTWSTDSLEVIQIAGSLLSPAIALACENAFGITPTILYGSTEVGTVTRGAFSADQPKRLGTVIDEVQLEIVDGNDVPVAPDGHGRIRMRRDPMPEGYWLGEPSAGTGFLAGWFYPGDTGSLSPSGELTLAGRTNEVVNAGGSKVNLAELDLWLSEIDALSDVATFQFLSELDEPLLGLAFVSETAIAAEDLERTIARRVSGVRFHSLIRLTSIPRNALGKVDRNRLTELTTKDSHG
ncbi:MAG TPA: class I adenylate-forming enzyme family protein [Microbacteriaceae bacterium]|nr:class I adenylate-forming enzyme family protein [Microbacteriaceae bacterium]